MLIGACRHTHTHTHKKQVLLGKSDNTLHAELDVSGQIFTTLPSRPLSFEKKKKLIKAAQTSSITRPRKLVSVQSCK